MRNYEKIISAASLAMLCLSCGKNSATVREGFEIGWGFGQPAYVAFQGKAKDGLLLEGEVYLGYVDYLIMQMERYSGDLSQGVFTLEKRLYDSVGIEFQVLSTWTFPDFPSEKYAMGKSNGERTFSYSFPDSTDFSDCPYSSGGISYVLIYVDKESGEQIAWPTDTDRGEWAGVSVQFDFQIKDGSLKLGYQPWTQSDAPDSN